MWTSIVIGTVAAALLAAVTVGVLPSPVSAADYEQTQKQEEAQSDSVLHLDPESTPYGPYEMMTPEQRSTYVKIRQFQQQWQQRRSQIAHSRACTEEPLRGVEPETVSLPVSPEELDHIWHSPLAVETYVSSPFGMRLHPVYRYYRMHNGVDLDSDRGDDILAARGGTVIASGWHSSYGYYVRIDHGDGFVTEYFHMSRRLVQKDEVVAAGDVIGRVGSSGVSTGSHLHFGMLFEGEYVDPEDYIEF